MGRRACSCLTAPLHQGDEATGMGAGLFVPHGAPIPVASELERPAEGRRYLVKKPTLRYSVSVYSLLMKTTFLYLFNHYQDQGRTLL